MTLGFKLERRLMKQFYCAIMSLLVFLENQEQQSNQVLLPPKEKMSMTGLREKVSKQFIHD